LKELVGVARSTGPYLQLHTVRGRAIRHVETFVGECLNLPNKGKDRNGPGDISVWVNRVEVRVDAFNKGHLCTIGVGGSGNAVGTPSGRRYGDGLRRTGIGRPDPHLIRISTGAGPNLNHIPIVNQPIREVDAFVGSAPLESRVGQGDTVGLYFPQRMSRSEAACRLH
jgi:hypothetical protein